MATVNTNPVLGAVVFARHGDRAGFYQSPTSYTPTGTVITPLGLQQEYDLGALMRSIYANSTSPNTITGLSTTGLVASQISSTADGGGEGGVIFDSAIAFWQGFYPPTASLAVTTLANGTTVTSPLGGYQYVQVNAVLPTQAQTFEGWTSCPKWTTYLNAFYNSTEFLQVQSQVAPFLVQLSNSGLFSNRTVALNNMWNIFDFMNVQRLHNSTYAALLASTGPDTLGRVRDLANFHEYGSFTDPSPGGIGNIAGRSFLPPIIDALHGFANNSAVKIAHLQLSYKPFLSFFNMTNMAASGYQYPQGIVDYASVATLELRKNMAGTGHDVRFTFKNGTGAADDESSAPVAYPLFGSSSVDVDLNTFVNNLQPYLLANTTSWCNACNNSVDNGCDIIMGYQKATAALASANATISSDHSGITKAAAGGIGAGVTIAVGLAVLALMSALGLVSFGKKRKSGSVNEKGSF